MCIVYCVLRISSTISLTVFILTDPIKYLLSRMKDLKMDLNCSQMHLDTTHEATYTLECLLLKISTKYDF